MWLFKKKKKNVMKPFAIEISADGTKYSFLIWHNKFDPEIAAAGYRFDKYSEAGDAALEAWEDIRKTREKLFSNK